MLPSGTVRTYSSCLSLLGSTTRRGKSSVLLARGRCSSPSVVLLSLSVAFLAEVLLGVSLSVDFLGLFPPPGVLRVFPDSGERFPWVVTFLFTEEHVVVPNISSESKGDLETPALDCPGAFPAGLLVTVLSGLNSDSSPLVDGSGE